jgi:transcriptional regulator with XRE-family HTH domain
MDGRGIGEAPRLQGIESTVIPTATVDPGPKDTGFDCDSAPTALAKMLHLRALKPSQVAKLAQCSPSTVSRAARGEKPLGNRLRAAVARALNCDERDLIDPAPSSAVREVVGALNLMGGGFPLPLRFDAAATDIGEMEQLAVAALGLIRANEPALASRVVERLLSRLAPETSANSLLAYSGRLIEWRDHLTPDRLAPAQRRFLERAMASAGDLTDGVLQPLIDDGCWARTSIYCADSDLTVRHLATGLDHVPTTQRLWQHGRPARDICAPQSLVSRLVVDLSHLRDRVEPYTVRHVRAEIGAQTHEWDCVSVRIGQFIVAACKTIETR